MWLNYPLREYFFLKSETNITIISVWLICLIDLTLQLTFNCLIGPISPSLKTLFLKKKWRKRTVLIFNVKWKFWISNQNSSQIIRLGMIFWNYSTYFDFLKLFHNAFYFFGKVIIFYEGVVHSLWLFFNLLLLHLKYFDFQKIRSNT